MKPNDFLSANSRYQWMGAICALLTFSVLCILHLSVTRETTTFEALAISMAGLILFFPLLKIVPAESRHGQYHRAYTKTLLALLATAATVTCVRYLTISREAVGGVDWYYYLCYSRDMVNNHPVSENIYSYFPGVYAIWTSVMRIFGQELTALQSFYQSALIMVCLLTGWVVRQHTHCKVLTYFSIFWTFVLLTKFDGLTGVTESLAVIPWLLGLILWRGRPVNNTESLWVLILFGAAIGLTVFTKQQAGLLSLGFVYLLAEQRQKKSGLHSWKRLLLIPITAIVTLVLAILCMGNSLVWLTEGLKTAGQYGTEQSWILNLYTQVRHDESLWISTLITVILFSRRGKWLKTATATNVPSWRLAGFSLVAALATLLQFKARPYHHYMLLSIPAMVIACSLIYHHYRSWLQESTCKRIVIGAIVILPCIWCAPYNDSYHPLRLQISTPHQWDRQYSAMHHATIQSVIESLNTQVPADSRMLILPGRYNQIHYYSATLSDQETGYNFRTRQFAASGDNWKKPLEQTSADYVLLLTGSIISKAEQQNWTKQRLFEANSILQKRGYTSVQDGLPQARAKLFRKQ